MLGRNATAAWQWQVGQGRADLPAELWVQVLSYLPALDIVLFQQVCFLDIS